MNMNIDGIEFTEEEILEQVKRMIGVFTLGETLDKIECGMYAISNAGPDEGMVLGVDKYGCVYRVDKFTINDIKNNEATATHYDLYLKKVNSEEAPAKRWVLFNYGSDALIYPEEKEESK